MGIFKFPKDVEDILKNNPAQRLIAESEGESIGTSKRGLAFNRAYLTLEVVNRGINLIADYFSMVEYDVNKSLSSINNKTTGKRLHNILNVAPNPYEDISSFRRNLIVDFLIEGNAFMYFDGAGMYFLPASRVEILTDKTTYIKGYKYDGQIEYGPDEVVSVKENSANSIYRGDSRLKSAQKSIDVLYSMLDYQENFFNNSAVPGLVLKTQDILSQKIKDRLVAQWQQKYNPRLGGKRPVVLDGGLDIDAVSATTFRELDFTESVGAHETRILKALGVPPILLDSGNNANIAPNLKLLFYSTILPIANAFCRAWERFYGFDLQVDTSGIPALQPELRDKAAYYTALVNNGVMTGAEAREALRLEEIPDEPLLDTIRIPANVAGSATGVSGQEGGKPTQEDEK